MSGGSPRSMKMICERASRASRANGAGIVGSPRESASGGCAGAKPPAFSKQNTEGTQGRRRVFLLPGHLGRDLAASDAGAVRRTEK